MTRQNKWVNEYGIALLTGPEEQELTPRIRKAVVSKCLANCNGDVKAAFGAANYLFNTREPSELLGMVLGWESIDKDPDPATYPPEFRDAALEEVVLELELENREKKKWLEKGPQAIQTLDNAIAKLQNDNQQILLSLGFDGAEPNMELFDNPDLALRIPEDEDEFDDEDFDDDDLDDDNDVEEDF